MAPFNAAKRMHFSDTLYVIIFNKRDVPRAASARMLATRHIFMFIARLFISPPCLSADYDAMTGCILPPHLYLQYQILALFDDDSNAALPLLRHIFTMLARMPQA